MTELRQQMMSEMQLRNFSTRTQKAYLNAVYKLAQYYRRSPEQINEKEVHDYLHHEIQRKLSWSSVNQKMNAFRFLYQETLKQRHWEFKLPRRRGEQRLPEILSMSEVERLFEATKNPKYRMIFKLTYGAGLRSEEVIRLKVSDIDGGRMVVRVRQAKGNKDRHVPLSMELLEELRGYWKLFRPKEWLFPGVNGDQPMNETSVQKSYCQAKEKAGLHKRGGIHTLRHCYATHLLEEGKTNLHTIQKRLGHGHLSSTQRYLQMARESAGETVSPYDLMKKRRQK